MKLDEIIYHKCREIAITEIGKEHTVTMPPFGRYMPKNNLNQFMSRNNLIVNVTKFQILDAKIWL